MVKACGGALVYKTARERNKQWSEYILRRLKGEKPPQPQNTDQCVCTVHGTCITHGQAIEDCKTDSRSQR